MSLLKPPITPEQFAVLPREYQTLLQPVIDHYGKHIAELDMELAAVETVRERDCAATLPRTQRQYTTLILFLSPLIAADARNVQRKIRHQLAYRGPPSHHKT